MKQAQKAVPGFEVWSFWKDGSTTVSKIRTKEKAEALARTLTQDLDCIGVDIYRKEWLGSFWDYRPVKWRKTAPENGG